MSYILKLVSWYPNQQNTHEGDFVQRHAKSIALYEKVIVVYATKSSTVDRYTIEKKVTHQLTEYIIYYPQKKIF
jgi:hypothetical protein